MKTIKTTQYYWGYRYRVVEIENTFFIERSTFKFFWKRIHKKPIKTLEKAIETIEQIGKPYTKNRKTFHYITDDDQSS